MNNTINSMNSISFQAKLDVSRVKGSKQRWQNIAKMFEEKTKRYANDVVVLDGSFKSGVDINLLDEGLLSFEEAVLNKKAMTKLKNMSDVDIVKNITDTFKFLKKERANITKCNKFAEQFNLENLDKKRGTSLEEKFFDLMAEISSAKKAEFIKKHPIFQNGGITI